MKEKSKVERQAYTGLPLKEGQILVPMLADENFIRTNEVSNDKIRSWQMAGVKYKVVFYPVKECERDSAMSEYYWNVNNFLDEKLGPNRDARCLIPQEDGAFKVCPKKCGDNRCACKDCPNKGIFEREDKSIVSLDEIRDEYELDVPASNNTEAEALLPIILDDLIEEVKAKDSRIYFVLSLLLCGAEKNDVLEAIRKKYHFSPKSKRPYDLYNKALAYLNKIFM